MPILKNAYRADDEVKFNETGAVWQLRVSVLKRFSSPEVIPNRFISICRICKSQEVVLLSYSMYRKERATLI